MGDLANMTSVHGDVDGHRLLRWLRGREEVEMGAALKAAQVGNAEVRLACMARANLLNTMADDLERELTPPDYPGDDGDTVDLDNPALAGGP